jgi:hypothetical protein
LGSNGLRWGTLAVIVAGVTPRQGERESRSQGKGPEVSSFNGLGWTEVLDLVVPSRND